MIEVSNLPIYDLFQVYIEKEITCPFKFAKKMRKYFEIHLQNTIIKDTCHSIFPNEYYTYDISDYLSVFLTRNEKYKIININDIDFNLKDKTQKLFILPYYEKKSPNIYQIFGMYYNEKPSLIIKYKERYISLIEERCLYLSHVLKYNGKEYGVLSMSNLFTVENVQRSYNLVRKYMEMCNTLSSRENRMICKDWVYQEISTYMFQVQLLSAESVFAHLNKYKVEEEVFYVCKEKEFLKVAKSFFVEIK